VTPVSLKIPRDGRLVDWQPPVTPAKPLVPVHQ
jgi:hypothetical protein